MNTGFSDESRLARYTSQWEVILIQIEKLSWPRLLMGGALTGAVICPGFLWLYVFARHTYETLDFVKLLPLAVAIPLPVFIYNFGHFLSHQVMERRKFGKDPERNVAYLTFVASMDYTLVLYPPMVFCAMVGWGWVACSVMIAVFQFILAIVRTANAIFTGRIAFADAVKFVSGRWDVSDSAKGEQPTPTPYGLLPDPATDTTATSTAEETRAEQPQAAAA